MDAKWNGYFNNMWHEIAVKINTIGFCMVEHNQNRRSVAEFLPLDFY